MSTLLALPHVIATLRSAGCVFAEDEAALLIAAADTPDQLASMIAQRQGGVPLEHIVGWAEFCGLRISVGPGVFIPRRRTEFLVSEAVRVLKTASTPVVLDLCCGSGNVGAALTVRLDRPELHASDIDPVAVRCAARNLVDVPIYAGDLYAPLPLSLRRRIDLVVADAPYVPTDELVFLPTEARLYEAPVALDGGRDGLDLHRRLAAGALDWLADRGTLMVETSSHQADSTAAIFAAAGLTPHIAHCDERDATVVSASLSRSEETR